MHASALQVVLSKPTPDARVEDGEFEENEAWALDIVLSTGEGKPKVGHGLHRLPWLLCRLGQTHAALHLHSRQRPALSLLSDDAVGAWQTRSHRMSVRETSVVATGARPFVNTRESAVCLAGAGREGDDGLQARSGRQLSPEAQSFARSVQ